MLFFWTKTGIPNNTYNNIHHNEDISSRIIGSIPNSHKMNEQQIGIKNEDISSRIIGIPNSHKMNETFIR